MRSALSVLFALSCRSESLPDASPPDADLTADAVPYDCSFIETARSECSLTEDFIVDLDRLGAEIIEPKKDEPTVEDCGRARLALDRALAVDPSSLTLEERIVAQNGAFRIFGPRSCPPSFEIPRRAASVVARLAPTRRELETIGAEPMTDADEWLGPRSGWIDRRTELPAFHETMEFFTQAFRPVRGRAIGVVSQMLAFDTDWRPHITPMVGRIEARRDLDPRAAACIGKLDVRRLRCASGRIAKVAEASLPHNTFVRRVGSGQVDCLRCHGSPDTSSNLTDVPMGDAHVDLRRARLLEEAKLGVESVRRKL